jgi:hypothetical protein
LRRAAAPARSLPRLEADIVAPRPFTPGREIERLIPRQLPLAALLRRSSTSRRGLAASTPSSASLLERLGGVHGSRRSLARASTSRCRSTDWQSSSRERARRQPRRAELRAPPARWKSPILYAVARADHRGRRGYAELRGRGRGRASITPGRWPT